MGIFTRVKATSSTESNVDILEEILSRIKNTEHANEEILRRVENTEQIVSKPPDASVKLREKYDQAKTKISDLRVDLDLSQSEVQKLQEKNGVLSVEVRRLREEAEHIENENIALNAHLRQLESNAREQIGILEKKNNDLKEDIDGLRATVVGAEFQAWDLGTLLKQYSTLRERWVSQFLFPGDAKDGVYLALTVEIVFHWTQSFINDRVKAITAAMYDDNQSETNIQFIKSTLQSNYANLETDLRNRITEAAKADENYRQLKESYIEFSGSKREVAHTNFDKLFNDVVKICGMLVLCEPRLDVTTKCDSKNPATFAIRITTAEVITVCFPGLILEEGGEYFWKEKVCVATSEDL